MRGVRRGVWRTVIPWVLGMLAIGLVWRGSFGSRAEALPTYGELPGFSLTDQTGSPFSDEALRGKVWVADFIFTRCAGQCPLMSGKMAQLAQELHDHSQVALVSISVDPDWDTPEVLAGYAERYGATPDQWHFLTGDREAIATLCREGFRLAMLEEGDLASGPMTHSLRFVLVDAHGAIRGYYEVSDASDQQRLRRDLQTLLRQMKS